MLREASVEIGANAATIFRSGQADRPEWHSVDRALRRIAKSRAGLDAEEARWLREAEACKIWRPLGMVSALDYMERVLGYGPRVAQDRLRVARALGALPEITLGLACGELSYSAVRELTRVATSATDGAWRKASLGKNLREIEALVADRRLGDRPDDPRDPRVRTHVVRFELSADVFASLRQARQVLDEEHGSRLSDDELFAALVGTVLEGGSRTEPTGRAKYQIAVTICERCRQGWQDGAGAKVAIGAAAVERACCDAQHIGSIDGATPERAYQDVPPSVARLVWRRDGGRCRVPGCRSSRGLELHHVTHRAAGGGHDAQNLALLCSACHLAHHAGLLAIAGTADQLEVRRIAGAGAGASTGAHVGEVEGGYGDSFAAARGVDAARGGAGAGAGDCCADTGAAADCCADTAADCCADTARCARCRDLTPTEGSARESNKLDVAILRTQAKQALVGLGWKSAIAQAAVAAAAATLGDGAPLERLIVEALRRCPRPTS